MEKELEGSACRSGWGFVPDWECMDQTHSEIVQIIHELHQ